jgi:hypothetical protein
MAIQESTRFGLPGAEKPYPLSSVASGSLAYFSEWPVKKRVLSDFLTENYSTGAYGSNINTAPAISVGARAPRKRYSGEIPTSPKRDARID